jgi:hypothetical protein
MDLVCGTTLAVVTVTTLLGVIGALRTVWRRSPLAPVVAALAAFGLVGIASSITIGFLWAARGL